MAGLGLYYTLEEIKEFSNSPNKYLLSSTMCQALVYIQQQTKEIEHLLSGRGDKKKLKKIIYQVRKCF